MTSILHISDTHFGTEQQPVVEAIEEHLKEHGADLLVLSGDITQRARSKQFAAAQAFIQRLDSYGIAQKLIVPGNHDIPLHDLVTRFLSPYENYRRYIGDQLEPVIENDELLIIGLNTTHPKRRKDGRVTEDQVRAVCERLKRSSPTKLRIVVAHQPFGSMVPSDLRNLQHGAREALRHWAEAGLDLVMGGHIHLPYVLPLSNQYPELAREIWIVQAGTALSSRLRGRLPNSFNRLYFNNRDGKQVRVERWDYQPQCCRFALSAHFDLKWPTHPAYQPNELASQT